MTKLLDLNSFDTVGQHNAGESFELIYKGNQTGAFLSIVGSLSDTVRDYEKAQLREYVRKQFIAEKKGTLEDLQVARVNALDNQKIENACIRVTGWTGIKDEFNKENLVRLFARNPQWIDEVINFSNELGK